jgi:HTH-type transcriptional regulator/antitoxin HigA
MADTKQNAIAIADMLSPPGDTLLEALEERGMTQKELAQRTGRPLKTINEIVRGKGAITIETALQFERVLGISARFWLTREQHYREALARKAETQRLNDQTGWLDKFPIQKMIKLGWIEKKGNKRDQLLEVLRFFGIATPNVWEDLWGETAIAFRRSVKGEADPFALSAWLQQGERQAYEIACQPYDERVFKQTIKALRALSTIDLQEYLQVIVQRCAQAGVAVVYVPASGVGLRTYGATYWLTSTKAVIQLSLLYKDDGHFWFTFFHEAGHILLDGKKAVFIEDGQSETEKEAVANSFAADLLIPPKAWQQFISASRPPSKEAIIAFAQELQIAPGIIVGRLQHEGIIPHTDCNGLKRKIDFPDDG